MRGTHTMVNVGLGKIEDDVCQTSVFGKVRATAFGLYPLCGNCYWQSTAPKQFMGASNLGGNLPLLEGFCTSNLSLVGGRWPAPPYSQFARWT